MTRPQDGPPLLATGVAGLDDILDGGLAPDRLYVLEGEAGAGKTTLALQFLIAGAQRGERGLLVTLSETTAEVQDMARAHGWSLDGISICELLPSEESLRRDAQYTMFHPSEVELAEATRRVIEETERIQPARAVFDSVSELRLLAGEPLRYRRQILALKHFFTGRHCTVLFTDDTRERRHEANLLSVAHGVISLEHRAPEYGVTRRQLLVRKLRGRSYREGYHDFRIQRGGLEVFPRLVAAEHATEPEREALPSGLASLDALLGGGLARGTSTLIQGHAGTGKSSLATQYATAVAARGERVAFFHFDEAIETFLTRADGLGMPARDQVAAGRLQLRQVDPAELSPGEFAANVRRAVDEDGARVVIIDSLNGYLHAMPSEQFLALHLHELLMFLGQRGVTTILIVAQHGLMVTESPIDTSYLADTIILTRFFEARGELRQAISVVKKRTGQHERTIHEMTIGPGGLVLGEPIRELQGILSGVPTFVTQTLTPSALEPGGAKA